MNGKVSTSSSWCGGVEVEESRTVKGWVCQHYRTQVPLCPDSWVCCWSYWQHISVIYYIGLNIRSRECRQLIKLSCIQPKAMFSISKTVQGALCVCVRVWRHFEKAVCQIVTSTLPWSLYLTSLHSLSIVTQYLNNLPITTQCLVQPPTTQHLDSQPIST